MFLDARASARAPKPHSTYYYLLRLRAIAVESVSYTLPEDGGTTVTVWNPDSEEASKIQNKIILKVHFIIYRIFKLISSTSSVKHN